MRYWAEALTHQNKDSELREKFAPVADAMLENTGMIVEDLNAAQGHPVDLGGYYKPNDEMASRAMRPSATLNGIIDSI